MLHIKWLVTLVVCVAAATATTFYATKQYEDERITAILAEASIARNTTYTVLATDIANGNYDVAKAKLRKLFDLEVSDIRRAKSLLENGFFKNANAVYLDAINRYLAEPERGR